MARRILAVLLLAMAAGQISDLTGFVDVLETYELGGRTTAWVLALPIRWILVEDAEFTSLAWWERRTDVSAPNDQRPERVVTDGTATTAQI